MIERSAEANAFRVTRARRLRRAQARGVTLLELLIVLSIMAIVAALVVPMFGGGVSTGELKGAARQVVAGLRLARSEALATRRETGVVLDLERRTFQVQRDGHEQALPKAIELKLFTAQSDLVSERSAPSASSPTVARTAAA